MLLTKFKLVKTEGLKGLFFKGDFIPFDRIDDTRAEQLFGKTHVLERITEPTSAVAVPELALATVVLTTEAEAPATSRKRASN